MKDFGPYMVGVTVILAICFVIYLANESSKDWWAKEYETRNKCIEKGGSLIIVEYTRSVCVFGKEATK